MPFRSIVMTLLAGLLAACTSHGEIREDGRFDHTRTYSAEYARVWSILQTLCTELPLERIKADQKVGTFVLRGNTYRADWADEGKRGRAFLTRDTVVARATEMTLLVSTQGAHMTRVKIIGAFNMRIRHGNGWWYAYTYRWQHAPTTGVAEDRILDTLEARLQQGKS